MPRKESAGALPTYSPRTATRSHSLTYARPQTWLNRLARTALPSYLSRRHFGRKYRHALIARVAQEWGQIDLLVNNAGVSSIAPAEQTSAQQFRRVLDINLTAPFLLSKAAGTKMVARGKGAIVNVASIAGLVGIADRVAYNASKHGLVGMSRTLAAEWGGCGVRVNAVCPGWVKTEMDVADQSSGGYTDDDITGRVPMGRFASPTDIARAILFLAGENMSSFVNGHTLVVDGGWTADGTWDSLRRSHRSSSA